MSSQIDAVILALTAKFVAAPALTGVRISDGPAPSEDPSTEWLFVGYDGAVTSEYTEGAVIEQDLMTFARGKKETGEVKCAAIVVSGDPNIVPLRQRAIAIMSAAEDAIRNDTTLGNLVMHSFVSAVTYIPTSTKGAKVRVVFTVTYQAQF